MTNFDEIPQEKFDSMQKVINNSLWKTQIKNLKINYIDIQDFKNINSISTELWDWNVIWWFNANWKSSFVEWILAAVLGQKLYGKWSIPPASLVKHGENKAAIKLLMRWEEQEIIVERIFKSWNVKKPAGETTLQATINGAKISQADLDNLLNNLTIDPLALRNLTITDQIKEIKTTLGINTFEIDKEIKSQEETTKEARAYEKQTKAIYENSIIGWVPEKIEEKSMSELLEKRKIFDELNQKTFEYSSKKQNIDNLEAQLLALQEKIANEKLELEEIKKQGIAIKNAIKEKGLTTLEELDQQIEEIETNNQNSRKYQEYLKQKEQVLKSSKDLDNEVEKLEKLRGQRTEMIANSNIPKYMEISDDLWILVDWIEYKLLNTARKIEVAIDLVLISGSPLRMVRIENWGELDMKTLEKIKQKIIANNFQIFIERPIIDKFDSIIINEWEIIEDKETFINNQ